MWKFWRENNNYIQGELVSKHSSQSAALKKAANEIEYKYTVKEEDTKETVIWLEDEDRKPIGIITKQKGTKRIRQGKKEK
jgi:aromatic ring hydroxylase